jgi:hypothetical protein
VAVEGRLAVGCNFVTAGFDALALPPPPKIDRPKLSRRWRTVGEGGLSDVWAVAWAHVSVQANPARRRSLQRIVRP